MGGIVNQPKIRAEQKAATRRRLIDSAQTLFAGKGYRRTTLEEIASHAGLHVQTLYRHFTNKEELAVACDAEKLDRFRKAVRNRKGDQTTFDFWVHFVAESAARVTEADGGQQYRETKRERGGPDVGVARGYEELLAESLEKEFPQPDEGPIPPITRLAAIALWGANAFVVRRYAADGDFELGVEAVAAARRVESIFLPLLVAASKP